MFIRKLNFKKYGMKKMQLDEKNVVVAISEISNIYQAMHKKDPCTTKI